MNFWRLVLTLSAKDLKQRYAKSWFNFALAIVHPLFSTLVFTVIFSKITRVHSEGRPYAAFFMAAYVPWAFLTTCIRAGSGCLAAQAPLVTRLHFPRAAIPLSMLVTESVPFILNLAVLAFTFRLLGVPVASSALLFLVPVFATQALLCLAIAFLLAPVTVYVRSVRGLLPISIQTWFLVSPVIYSLDAVPPRWRGWYELNPMTGILDGYRRIFLHHQAPEWRLLVPAAAGSAILLAAGVWVFRRLQRDVADVL